MKWPHEIEDYLRFSHLQGFQRSLETTTAEIERSLHATDLVMVTNPPPPRWREREELIVASAACALLLEDKRPEASAWQKLARVVGSHERHAPTAARARPAPPPAPVEKIAALEARIQKLEALVERLLAEREPSDEVEAPVPPEVRWMNANPDALRAHPDSFVALDPDEGIIVHATSGDDFETELRKLSPEQRDRVILFHTSMYV